MSKGNFDGKRCEYCGKTREVVRFCIGAQTVKPGAVPTEWTLHAGSGKLSCDSQICHAAALDEVAARRPRFVDGAAVMRIVDHGAK